MMVSRGSVLLSFCGFIALGALATACSSSSTTSPSTNAQVATYCDTLCTRASGCDRGIDKQTCAASCANQNAAVLPKLRQDVIGLITSCVDRKDCKDILTTNVAPTCSDEAAASVAPSALATDVCQSLETAQKKCGVTFDMAACLSRMKLYSEETLGQARTCTGKACTDIAACVEATLGSLAGYSTGGIQLDAGKPAPDVIINLGDGGASPTDATLDAPGLDSGPTPGDAGPSDTGPGPAEVGPEPTTEAGPDPIALNRPPSPPASGTPSTNKQYFAINKLWLGETDRNDVGTDKAWEKFGYDIDNKVTTPNSTDVCTRVAGASKVMQSDGANGTDNSFGHNVVPLLSVTIANPSHRATASLLDGSSGLLLEVTGLSDANLAQTAIGLQGTLYDTSAFGSAPTYAKTELWPVSPDLSPQRFPSAYQVDGTWVSGAPANLELSLFWMAATRVRVAVKSATITFKHESGKLVNGTISGVIETQALINEFKKVAGSVSIGLCSAGLFDTIANQIRQASDVMSNGTNASGKDCDAISIGLGFEAREVGGTKTGTSSPAPLDPCADAGN